jgi:hypothetical protein
MNEGLMTSDQTVAAPEAAATDPREMEAGQAMTDTEIITLARQADEGDTEAQERLRVAVALELGWSVRTRAIGYQGQLARSDWADPRGNVPAELPDWPRDIAAAFELGEEAEERGRSVEFVGALWRVVDNWRDFAIAQATPAQRCAAFLVACRGEGDGG